MRNRLAAISISLLFASACAQAASGWIRLANDRFDIVTDASPNRARQLLAALEQVRLAWGALELPLPAGAPPVRVFLFRDERLFRRFSSSPATHGLAQRGREREYILLPDGPQLAGAARHEFVHVASRHVEPWPRWLEEGLADYYSAMRVTRGGASVGRELPVRIAALSSPWLEPAALLSAAVLPESEQMFYAQSWALVTWLKHTGRFRPGVAEFLRARPDQAEEAAAFAIGFRMTARDALDAARSMVEQKQFPATYFDLPAPPPPPAHAALAEPQRLLLMADLSLAFERSGMAAEFRDRLAALASDPDIMAASGMLSLQAGDAPRAEKELEQAVASGTRVPGAYYELAALRRDRRAPAAAVIPLLERAAALSPTFAEAWFLLGRLRTGREAEMALERAASLQPRRAPFWNELAGARLALGHRDLARQAARAALAAARNQDEAEYARGLLRLIDLPAPSPVTVAPRPVTPRRELSVEGALVHVDCAAAGYLFHVESGPRRWVFAAARPERISLTGKSAATREFSCGPQRATPVRVEYLPKLDPQRNSDGELTALEFR